MMPAPLSGLCLAGALAIAVSLPVWCYAALAQWLTREHLCSGVFTA
jgi:hypothetical protein